jgi:hypothetical protein
LALDGSEWSASCPGHFIQGKRPWYPLDRRLGGPQSWSGCGRKEKLSIALLENEHPCCPACSLATKFGKIPQLSFYNLTFLKYFAVCSKHRIITKCFELHTQRLQGSKGTEMSWKEKINQ